MWCTVRDEEFRKKGHFARAVTKIESHGHGVHVLVVAVYSKFNQNATVGRSL